MKSQILYGAEAIISLKNNQITKNRIKKSYRLKELDEKLRFRRTKSEAKIIEKLKNIIAVPKILETDNKEKIIMQFIQGKRLSDYLDNLKNQEQVCKQIGKNISLLHDNDIIHGDLTTSNMILVENSKKNSFTNTQNNPKNSKKTQSFKQHHTNLKETNPHYNKSNELVINNKNSTQSKASNNLQIYFIDFGLSFHSKRIEDKAVDLHLLRQALNAKHYKIADECFKIILDNYNPEKTELIKQRINTIASRGRYKDKH